MRRSRSSSLITSDTAYEYIGFRHKHASLRCAKSLSRLSIENQGHESGSIGRLQVFRDALSGCKERQRLARANGFVEDGANGTGFVEHGDEQTLLPQDCHSVYHT